MGASRPPHTHPIFGLGLSGAGQPRCPGPVWEARLGHGFMTGIGQTVGMGSPAADALIAWFEKNRWEASCIDGMGGSDGSDQQTPL